ncbi:MAG: hypothetical protein ACE5K3_03525 [bacterium]
MGRLESTVPLTIPQVWICAQCGRNPGAYGFWDFTYRDDFSYLETKAVNPEVTRRVDLLYTILPKLMQKVAVIGVPFTWPPPKIPGGYAISGFTAPTLGHSFTYPDSLKEEVYKLVGDYIINANKTQVDCGRIDNERMLKNIYEEVFKCLFHVKE